MVNHDIGKQITKHKQKEEGRDHTHATSKLQIKEKPTKLNKGLLMFETIGLNIKLLSFFSSPKSLLWHPTPHAHPMKTFFL